MTRLENIEQARNKSTTHYLEYNGLCMCVTDWAKHIGINKQTLFSRLHRGWSIKEALKRGVQVHAIIAR